MRILTRISLVTAAVVALNCVAVFAAGVEGYDELTVEAAVSKATSNSSALKKLALEAEANDETATKNKTNFLNGASKTTAIDYKISEMQSDISAAMNESDTVKQKDLIEYSVTQYFLAIIEAEGDYEMYKRELDQEQKNLKLTEIKGSHGLISNAEIESARTSYTKKEALKADYEKALDNAYKALNDLLGDKEGTRYNLVYSAAYQELGEFDLNQYIIRCQSSDPTIVSKEGSVDINQMNITYYYYKNVDWSTGELKASATRESYERSISSLNMEITERKKTISDTLTKSYEDILNAEKSYKDMLNELDSMKVELSRKNVQYSLGQITLNTLENYELSIAKLEHEILKAEYAHELMVTKFKNQNLAL